MKRFYRLMIPYFTMSVIFTLAHHALQAYALYASSLSDIWKLFLGESLYTAMWFLYALFLINALTLVFVRPQNVRIWLIASLIPLALYVMKLIPNKTIFKPLNFCASYLFWYLLGVEISHFYESIYTRFQARLGRIAIAATLAHTVTFSLAFAFGFPFGHNFWKSLCSCFAAVALYAYGMSLFRNGKLAEGHHIFSSWWRIFSKYGMDIYILHDLVIFAVRLVFWNFLHWPFAVCTLLKFIFGLFGSLAVSVLIIRKSAILKKFLFGEGW